MSEIEHSENSSQNEVRVMSDIEILLRELIDKVDDLEKKIDRIEKQVTPPKLDVSFDWGDDSCGRFIQTLESMKGDKKETLY